MADNPTGGHEHVSSNVDVVKEKITETFHDEDSSSSSDSDAKSKAKAKKDYPVPQKKIIKNVSWKDKPVYDLLGGGKCMHLYENYDLLFSIHVQIIPMMFILREL